MNTIANSVVARPVRVKDIAEKLSLPLSTVANCLNTTNPDIARRYSAEKVSLVRRTAEQMGYDRKVACDYGNKVKKGGSGKHWYNGNFNTREEELARMKELREQGFSNAEVAKKTGRSLRTVNRNIGKQDEEMTRQNIAMGARIRAQKNAARKLYVVNKKVVEYNKKVEKHNKMKAELNMLQIELLEQKPTIEQTAQTVIEMPMIDLHTVQPTALM